MKSDKYKVEESITLIEFLLKSTNESKSKLKSLLKYKNIFVNSSIVKRLDTKLKKNDIVEIKRGVNKNNQTDLDIIYEDDKLLVINKKYGLLTIATEKEKKNTLYHMASEYVKKSHKNNKIFIIHRLDKDTSGLVVFAKDENTKDLFQKNWNNIARTREYIAVVEGILQKKKDTLKYYLIENDSYKVKITNNQYISKLAITDYEVIKEKNNISMLKVNIKTGRKNQIRVSLKEIGHTILGDLKYESKKDPLKRLCLHAIMLEIKSPIDNKIYKFDTKVPNSFNRLFK